jgi:hypothetical protein
LRQHCYLLLAHWIMKTAFALAMKRWISPATVRFACRQSARLSRRSLAIWHAQR